MKKKTTLLIDTVMETSIVASHLLPFNFVLDFYEKEMGEQFELTDNFEVDLKVLQYFFARKATERTWKTGYYDDLLDWKIADAYISITWDTY